MNNHQTGNGFRNSHVGQQKKTHLVKECIYLQIYCFAVNCFILSILKKSQLVKWLLSPAPKFEIKAIFRMYA